MGQPTVLITGASSGIGAVAAAHLLSKGWRVLAAARRVEAMAPLAADGAEVLPLDIADPASRQRLAAQVRERVGALDALVNNAGLGRWALWKRCRSSGRERSSRSTCSD